MRYELFHFFLVTCLVTLSKFCKSFQILRSLALPNLSDFFHNMKRGYVRHILGYSNSCFTDKKHVSSQRFLRHLVQKSLIPNFAELSQFICKPLLISFSSISVFLSLILGEFLPFNCDHFNNLGHLKPWVLLLYHFSLLVSEKHISTLWFFQWNIFSIVKLTIRKFAHVCVIDTDLAIRRWQHWTKAVIAVTVFLVFSFLDSFLNGLEVFT